MAWVIVIVTGVVVAVAVPLLLAYWRLERGAFRYPDEEEEAAAAQAAKNAAGTVVRRGRTKRRVRRSQRPAEHDGAPPGATDLDDHPAKEQTR